MEQSTINNGHEFVIDTKTQVTDEDSIYFRDNGDHISVAIENAGEEDSTYLIYKKAARELYNWLGNHLKE